MGETEDPRSGNGAGGFDPIRNGYRFENFGVVRLARNDGGKFRTARRSLDGWVVSSAEKKGKGTIEMLNLKTVHAGGRNEECASFRETAGMKSGAKNPFVKSGRPKKLAMLF